jgi:hypothetical protein
MSITAIVRAGGGGGHAVETTRTATPPERHRAATTPARRLKSCGGRKSATTGDNNGFPAFSPRLRNLLLPDKFKPLGITKYDVKQDPIQWLRCYALSIENAGGNNDTKCQWRSCRVCQVCTGIPCDPGKC